MSKIFGTSGVRDIYPHGKGPEFYNWLGRSVGTWLRKNRESKIILGWDTRPSAGVVMGAFASGLMEAGVSVAKTGIVPTPTLSYTCHRFGLYGAMITASHNPPEYTGVKIIAPSGRVLTAEEEPLTEPSPVSWERLGKEEWILDSIEKHVEKVLEYYTSSKKRKIVVDTKQGATCDVTPLLLRKMGHTVVTINTTKGGKLSTFTPGGPIETLIPTVNAELGIIHDPDGDRVLFMDERGKLIDPVLMLATIIKRLKKGTTVVVPINTPAVVDMAAKENDIKVIRTRVGDTYISQKIHELTKSEKYLFGGESSGTFVWPELHYGPETLRTIVEVLRIMDSEGLKASELTIEFNPPKIQRDKVECPNEIKEKIMEIVKKKLPEIIDGEVKTIDGVYVRKESTWILVRPSGTEPIIRITGENAEEIFNRVKELVVDAIRTIS